MTLIQSAHAVLWVGVIFVLKRLHLSRSTLRREDELRAGLTDVHQALLLRNPEVERNADDGKLKAAFRKLAMKWHPDKNPGDATSEVRFNQRSLRGPEGRREARRL